jgi:hypothetical protein
MTEYNNKQESDIDQSNRQDTLPSSSMSANGTKQTVASHTNVLDFLHSKIERLGTALYMVTSYMPGEEPVRMSLRVAALSSTAAATHLKVKDENAHLLEIEKDITHIISLLRLSHTIGIVSDMNGRVLTEEYQKVLSVILAQKGHRAVLPLSLGDLFEPHEYSHFSPKGHKLQSGIAAPDPRLAATSNQGADTMPAEAQANKLANKIESVTQGKTESTKIVIAPNNQATNQTNKSNVSRVSTYSVASKKVTKVSDTSSVNREASQENKERRNARQMQVLAAVSTEREMSIRDVADRVKGCSEKTIQRELNTLVEKHKIRRIGEKRWSRYLRVQ